MGHQPERQPGEEFEPQDVSGIEREPAASQAAQPIATGQLLGQTLGNRYRFDALIGEGSFARVFKVFDLDRQVHLAAKVLRSDIADEPAFLARFKREAAVLERLQHPNIVRYYDIIESDPHVFILTDFIEGRTLQRMLRDQSAPITPYDSLQYLRPLAAALHFAHREGVVHRDLKPANILIDGSENTYVTDFGIARILTDTSTLTVDTTVGTPHYMSPEQILTGEITAATDIYAFGIMLYQMYTGALPFTGESDSSTGTTSAMRIVYEHLHTAPTRPTELNPRLSVAVEGVILRCLEKDPAQRFGSINEMYEALTDAIGTPSVSLDAAAVAAVADVTPVAERVPTGVGGLSRVAPVEAYADDEYGEYDEITGVAEKPKRKSKARVETQIDFGELPEKQGEKQTEKERDTVEKQQSSEEKEQEKGPEKGEFWSDFGVSDRLSTVVWGGMFLWAGIVYLLEFSTPWGWILGGAGGLLLIETGARLMLPEFRQRPGARLVVGLVLAAVGVNLVVGIANLWALVLIAVGVGLLLSHLSR